MAISARCNFRGLVALLVTAVLLGCGDEPGSSTTEMGRARVTYLEHMVPACTPIGDSGIDPCSSRDTMKVESVTASSGWPFWVLSGVFPSYTEVLLGLGFPSIASHIVIRGVVLTDSTRCELYPLEDYAFEGDRIPWKNAYHYSCFSEVAVREYIVGEGPATVSVILHFEFLGLDQDKVDNWDSNRLDVVTGLDYPKLRTAAAYENRELVLFLAPASTVSVESWQAIASSTSFWFVQRSGNEVRAVSPDIVWADTVEERAALDMPLADLVAKIKAADAERRKLTGGRVGITAVDGAVAGDGDGESFPPAQGVREGATLPMLVTDANKLQDYYVAAGAVYDGEGKTTVLPPPPPEDFVGSSGFRGE